MLPRKSLFLILFALLPLLTLSAQQKYALVIGNGAYTGITRLNNPVNDANDVSAALRGLGFTVEQVTNAGRVQMEEAVTRLKNRLGAARTSYGFFFYAGHGVQSGGENYLIPVDANIPSEAYLRDRSVSMQAVLDELNTAGNALNIVVLDACRDNPFGWRRSGSRGLQVVSSQPADSIIVYATSAGSAAADGTGRNGLFTTHLLNNLKKPGLSVRDVFDQTGADVRRASGGTQIPAIYSQFFDIAYLGTRPPAVAPSPAPAPRPAPAVTPPPQIPAVPESEWTAAGDFDLDRGRFITITNYKGTAAIVNIPARIDGIPVGAIANSAFKDCITLTSITIPDSVTSIESNAFSGCASLSSITIPNRVTKIESGVFSGCNNLASITIPDSVTSIGSYVFQDCASLASVTIPNRVTKIENGVFSGCNNLASITIPDSVTSIESFAFKDCASLASITIPNRVTSIEMYAFSDCTGLASVTIPNRVTKIENGVFSGCNSLTSVTIPNSVTSIGSNAFRGCASLASVTIPNSVTSIESFAFYGCTGLASVTMPNSVTSIGSYVFYGCTGLSAAAREAIRRRFGNAVF